MSDLIKKLKFKPGQITYLIHLPANLRKEFKTLKERGETPVQILCFNENTTQLKAAVKQINALLNEDTICWMAYMKGTAKINTDLNRDKGWDVLWALGWEAIASISLDDTWTALRFKPSEKIKRQSEHQSGTHHQFIDVEKRIIHKLPADLQKALKASDVLKAFQTQAYTHQKEAIIAVVEAKKEETRIKRIEQIVDKLLG